MRETDDLIASLAREDGAPEKGAQTRFLLPLAGAALICAIAMLAWPDLQLAPLHERGMASLVFKWVFSLVLMLGGAFALHALGRPGRDARLRVAALAVPFAVALVMLAVGYAHAGEGFPGATWRTCLAAMSIMSPIGFAGAIMATRWLAPTRLRTAGLVAGLFGGGVAMAAYAPFCPEHGMAYLAVFYCLPILAMAAIGWLAGPRLLRW